MDRITLSNMGTSADFSYFAKLKVNNITIPDAYLIPDNQWENSPSEWPLIEQGDNCLFN